METTRNFTKDLHDLKRILTAGYTEQDAEEDLYVPDLLSECFIAYDDQEDDPSYYECGSFAVADTPKALYRALYAFKPSAADFSDMYKSNLLCVASPCRRFVAAIHFFKYELGVYQYAPREAVDFAESKGVRGGWPGADNGERLVNETGRLFFATVRAVLESEHDVYPGNNFRV